METRLDCPVFLLRLKSMMLSLKSPPSGSSVPRIPKIKTFQRYSSSVGKGKFLSSNSRSSLVGEMGRVFDPNKLPIFCHQGRFSAVITLEACPKLKRKKIKTTKPIHKRIFFLVFFG